MSLLRELNRRNVFKVGAAYAVVAWLVLQVSDVVLNNVQAPEWVFFAILLVIGIGFIFTLIFAWVYEMTPEGLKREREIDREQSITHHTGRKLNVVIVVLLGLALGYFAVDKYVLSTPREAAPVEVVTPEAIAAPATGSGNAPDDKSIAVLPFVNLSSDPEQEYFSDGISEELLNLLAKIPELHVTSRTSAFAFKGKEMNIPDVASQLGVAHVLEGSVRKSGVKVRITAQLIEAQSDKHLWSETYDRDLDDIFAIQDEISAAIVEALVDTMALESGEVIPVHSAPIGNTEAYTTFLLGRHQRNLRTSEGYAAAKELFQKAVDQDPQFAPAHAQLAQSWLLEAAGYGDGSVSMEEAVAAAEPLIDRALDLDPNLADAYATRGLMLRFLENDSGAMVELQKALELNPSHSLARNWLSMAYRKLRRSEDELETLRMGHRLDPLTMAMATNLVKSLSRFGQHEEAARVLDTLSDLAVPDYAFSLSEALMLQGRYADAIEAALHGAEEYPDSVFTFFMASYLLGALGEQVEAGRLDPWEGGYKDFSMALEYEIRDPVELLASLRHYDLDGMDPRSQLALAWAHLGSGDVSTARSLATTRLETLGRELRKIDGANLVLAIIAFREGNPVQALEQMELLEQITDINLAAGDNISLNHLIKAIAEYFRGNESAVAAHLREGFNRKAPMSFEGENVFSVYAALGWNEHPVFRNLLDEWEAYNAQELRRIFDLACNQNGFTVWVPLPESCEKYAPVVASR